MPNLEDIIDIASGVENESKKFSTEIDPDMKALLKTLTSKNITLSQWNAAITQLGLNVADVRRTYSILKNVAKDLDSNLRTALDVANTYTDELKNGAVTTNTNAISAIKNGTTIDSFADVETALAGKQANGDYATKTEAQGYATTAKNAVIGTDSDTKDNDTVKGAKKYAYSVAQTAETNAKSHADSAAQTAEINAKSYTAALVSAGWTREIVSVLPTPENAKSNAIYMIKRSEGLDANDVYDEYFLVNDNGVPKLELMGNTELDLSQYTPLGKSSDAPDSKTYYGLSNRMDDIENNIGDVEVSGDLNKYYDLIVTSEADFDNCLYKLFVDEDTLTDPEATTAFASGSASLGAPDENFKHEKVLVKGITFTKQHGFSDVRMHIFQPSIKYIRFENCRWETEWNVSGAVPTAVKNAYGFEAAPNLTLTVSGVHITEDNVNSTPPTRFWEVRFNNIKRATDCAIDYPAGYVRPANRTSRLAFKYFSFVDSCKVTYLYYGTNVANCIVSDRILGCKNCVNVIGDPNVTHTPLAESCDGISNFQGVDISTTHPNTNVAATEEDIAVVEDRISSVESRVTGIEQYLGGDNFIVDDSIAYAKVVPKNACEKAKILSVGGMSYKSKNLVDIGTVTFDVSKTFNVSSLEVGKTYYISTRITSNDTDTTTNQIGVRYEDGTHFYPLFTRDTRVKKAFTPTKNVISMTLFAGQNYPLSEGDTATYEDFMVCEEDTDVYVPYFAGLRHTKVTEMKSEGANLIPFPYTDTTGAGYTETKNGVTFAVLAGGGISINGLCEKGSPFTIARGINYFSEPIYIGTNKPSSITKEGLCLSFNSTIPTADISIFYENSVRPWLYIYVKAGVTYNGVIYPMLNYGTTAAPYKPYRVDNPIGTLAIPEAVQALDGYGVGVDADYYNHLKVVGNKVFYHKVCEKVVLDGAREKINEVTQSASGLYVANAIMPRAAAAPYHFITSHFIAQYKKALGYSWLTSSPVTALFMCNTDQSLTTVDAWNAWLAEQSASGNPVTVVYALANPTVTDVTEHFTATPFIEVEGDGALTAVNEYKQAAPSNVKYLVTYPKEV